MVLVNYVRELHITMVCAVVHPCILLVPERQVAAMAVWAVEIVSMHVISMLFTLTKRLDCQRLMRIRVPDAVPVSRLVRA